VNTSDGSPADLLARTVALQRAERFADAEILARRAAEQAPDLPSAHCVHGGTLFHIDRIEDAIAAFRRAVALRPAYVNALCNLGTALHRCEKYGDAETAYRAALDADPNYALAKTGLAATLQESRKRGVTLAKINISIGAGRKPRVTTLATKGSIAERRREEARNVIAAFRDAAELAPEDGLAASQLYFELRHACDWTDLAAAEAQVDTLTARDIEEQTVPGEHAFIHIARVEDTAQNLAVARLHANAIARKLSRRGALPYTHSRPTSEKTRLRLGYLSADFRDHAIGHLVAGLFAHHDRTRFEVFAYAHGEADGSDFRARIAGSADRFLDIDNLDDTAAAARLHQDGIDILIDLSGQIRGHRMEIAALRPAPLQVAYIGFPGTSGADFIDYIFTDRIVTPESHLESYSEAPAYLPHCYLITDDAQPISDASVTRAAQNLPEDAIVFCSFNQGFKITPDVFDAWCEILRRVDGSVLWLLEKNPLAQFNLRTEAEQRGVPGARLIFANRAPKPDHMARTRLADLALDTGIYTGHVTTCDMLWAGVPVVTRLGNHFASRVSASALRAAGVPELITDTWEDFISLAIRLATDASEREAFRVRLKEGRQSAPLFDTARSVRALEAGFEEMWRRHSAGQPPGRIDIPDR
jgi:protein O-GlcNAc transferase